MTYLYVCEETYCSNDAPTDSQRMELKLGQLRVFAYVNPSWIECDDDLTWFDIPKK